MKYVAFYDTKEYLNENRSIALCGANVSEYMIDVFSEFGELQVVSPSRTRNKKGIYRGRKCRLNKNTTLAQPFTFGVKTPIGRFFAICWNLIWLCFYLFFHTKKNETLIVYHSLSIMRPVRLIKKLRKINLVLEIREFYSDARQEYEEFGQDMSKLHKKEMKYFQIADKYIFPTELLNKEVNIDNKPYVVAPGIYRAEKRLAERKWNDGKIHIVYAGTLRKSKGVYDAIEVAERLPDNYYVHILGGGDKDRIAEVKEDVQRISKTSKAKVCYEGQLRDDEFKTFLQKCHIGLSPQSKDATFNETSFPSKIFTYLANGLEVVSVKIPAITESPVGEYLHYYDGNLDSLAEAIQSIEIKQKENSILDELDSELRYKAKEVLFS